MESFKIEHKVKVKEFDRTLIDLVPYDDSIIGDSDETTYENYINLHGKTYPDILDSIRSVDRRRRRRLRRAVKAAL